MANLLVIGGSGFFGKSILDSYRRGLLSAWGIDSIIIVSRNAISLKRYFPELIDESIKLVNSDISNCSEIPKADYVIHAAASTDAANYLARPDLEKKNIQAGTYNYCALAKKFHNNSRIVYCSSGAIYGQQPDGIEQLREDFIGGPVSLMSPTKRDYAAAKRDAEQAINTLGSEGNSVSIARCFAFVGEYLPRDQHFAIGNFIEDGLKSRSIEVKARHIVIRSYMHADDLVRWLMTICNFSNTSCPIYNVGSDQALTMTQVAEHVAAQFKVDVVKPVWDINTIDRYVPSINKAKVELGLDISMDITKAIKATVDSINAKNSRN